MLACADVHYREGRAFAACLTFTHWTAAEPVRVLRTSLGAAADYRSGEFYRRELPALLAVLALSPSRVEAVVIDGYVWLGGGEPGLGARLYEALGGTTSVIGVAKSRLMDDRCSLEVVRGSSLRPLYVTATGVDTDEAARAIRSMHGLHRIPTLLRLADAASRL